MAINITVPTDTKIGVAVSGGFDSAVLWYEVYKICLERGQECVPVTAPQYQHSRDVVNEILSCIAEELGGDVTETTIVGSAAWNAEIEDNAGVIARTFDELNDNTDTYGSNFFVGQAVDHDPTGELENYKIQRFGTANLCSLIEANHPEIDWHFPFQSSTKVDILTHMSESNAEICTELLTLSSSCFTPATNAGEPTRCGSCASCIERQWACDTVGITDLGTR